MIITQKLEIINTKKNKKRKRLHKKTNSAIIKEYKSKNSLRGEKNGNTYINIYINIYNICINSICSTTNKTIRNKNKRLLVIYRSKPNVR